MAELVYFLNRFNRDIKIFLISILQRDFSIHFKENNKVFGELYKGLNDITSLYKTISTEKEVKHRYLELLVEHVGMGILSYDEDEKVELVNSSFLKLVNKPSLSVISHLQSFSADLLKTIREIKPKETKLLKIQRGNELLSLSIHSSEFRLEDSFFKLVSVQNITHELNAQELEAWQKLIRVLTHEIMNSVAPIISLSDTLHTMVQRQEKELSQLSIWKNLQQGLEAIKVRGEGLHYFTQKYREVTHVPTPDFKLTNLQKFIDRVVSLFKPVITELKMELIIEVEPVTIAMDEKLMGQALINLIQNSIEAVESIHRPVISIKAYSLQERVQILIIDNGNGIDPRDQDKIFVPFFTTKKSGSGVGLALVRQIILLHKGEITVQSNASDGTVFSIII